MSTTEIAYERRAHRFALACTCGWTGNTTNLSVVAQPIAEHLRACDGDRPKARTPYNADTFDADRRSKQDRDTEVMPSTREGDRPGNAKLDPDEVREIRQRYADGEPRRDLANRFGLTPSAISAIVLRRTWRHVD